VLLIEVFRHLQAAYGIAAEWEAETDRKIAKNAVRRELNKLRDARTARLDARRERLAQKLYAEDEALRAELIGSKITPEERRASLAVRATSLWEAREAERQAEASALLERHFRYLPVAVHRPYFSTLPFQHSTLP
jgi:cilia- and flagella-associated protein 53